MTQLAQGRYELRSTLGSGGMATVYRAWDTMLHVERAIKVLEPRLTKSPTLRTRFLNEARTMARLSHPAIVPVVDLGVDGQHTFLVMELVDGGSLHDRLAREGPMAPHEAARVVLAVLEGLQVAHDAGIVHRDIKPQNILLDRGGRPRLSDFGIAHVSDTTQQLTRTGSVMGTVGFMAPEQRISARRVDNRADIYAMGTTLFAALTGEMPIELYASAFDDELLAGIPEALVPVIQRSTAYKPEHRYAGAAEMGEALRQAIEIVPEDAPPVVRTAATAGATIAFEEEPPPAPGGSQPTLFVGEPEPMVSGPQPGEPQPPEPVASEPQAPRPAGVEAAPTPRRRGLLLGLVALVALGGVGVLLGKLTVGSEAPEAEAPAELEVEPELEPVSPPEPVAAPKAKPKLVKQVEGPAEPPEVEPEPRSASADGSGLSGLWTGSLNRGDLELDLVFSEGGEVAGSASYTISGFQVNTPVRGQYDIDEAARGTITLHGQRSGGRVFLEGEVDGDSMRGTGQVGPRDVSWSVGLW